MYTGAASNRATVTALAGVTSALGPKANPGWRGVLVRGVAHEDGAPARAGTALRSPAGTPRRSGPSAPVMRISTRLPTGIPEGTCTMPSISGASCGVRPRPGASTRTRANGPDEAVPLGRGDGVLELGALAQALERELGRHLVGEAGGVRPVLVGEGEEAGPIELRVRQELEEQVVVALGLAGVAEDERGPEGGIGIGGPDVGDAAQEALAVAPAAHAGEQRARHVLEREVEVGHTGVQDRLDQLVGEAGRVEVEEPGALDPHRDGASEGGNGRVAVGDARTPGRARAVAAVRGEVLCDEDDLAQRGGTVGWRASSASTSARISSGDRDRCLPRKEGMAQKPQMRSHPSATFT